MNTLKINHIAVWVSVVLSFALGFLWYGAIFGDAWMAMVELDPAVVEANPPGVGVWVTNTLASVVQMYVLAWLFTKMNVDNGMHGAMIGLLIGLTFNHLPGMTSGMFSQYPYGLAWVTGGFSMALLAIAGFVLGVWTKKED